MERSQRNRMIIIISCYILVALTYFILYLNVNIYGRLIEDGYLDLSKVDLTDQIIQLDGQWEFYPGVLKEGIGEEKQYIAVPGTWRNFNDSKETLGKYGIATYRLRIQINQVGEYAIRLGYVSSAYRLYLNQQLLITNGTIGETKQEEKSDWAQRIVYFHTEDTQLELVVEVSNYHCNNGGIIKNLFFGTQNTMHAYEMKSIIGNVIFLGLFLGMAFYLAAFNWCINKSSLSIPLVTFSISSFIASSIIAGGGLMQLFGQLSTDVTMKAEYVSFMVQIISIQYFLWNIYPDVFKKRWTNCIKCLDYGYTAVILVLPHMGLLFDDYVFLPILFANIILYLLVVIKASIKKKPFAVWFLVGMLVMVVASVLQLLDIRSFFDTKYVIECNFYLIGGLTFLMCETYVLIADVEGTFAEAKVATKMEIASLQAQISPHFLFNVLNNIYCLMNTNLELAKKLVLNLCEFLRVKYRFDYRKQVFYSLREELDMVKAYVELEKVRLGGKISLEVEVKEEDLETKILPLTIQPLVENSIKHGFDAKEMKLLIQVVQEAGEVVISLTDNGKGMGIQTLQEINQDGGNSHGVGLQNINYRLMKSYHTKLCVESTSGVGTKVQFRIPKEKYYGSCNNR